MMKLTCPKCRFSMKLPDHKVNGREFCPSCNGGLMEFSERDQSKLSGGWKRKKRGPVDTPPGVIRNLIFGIVLVVFGLSANAWAASRWNQAGIVAAVFMGHGIVLTVTGIIALIMAALGKKD
jgi:hypothetical protein